MILFCARVVSVLLLALPQLCSAKRTTREQMISHGHRQLPIYPNYSPSAPTKSPHIIQHSDEPDCEGWGEGTEFFGQLEIPVSIFRSSAARGSSETSRYWYHNNCQQNRGSIQPILGATFNPTPLPSVQPTTSPSPQPSMIAAPTLTPSDFPSLNPTATANTVTTNLPTTSMMASLSPSISSSLSNQPVSSAVPSSSSSATSGPTPSSANIQVQLTLPPSAVMIDPADTPTIGPTTVPSAGGTAAFSMVETQTQAPTVLGMTTAPQVVDTPNTLDPSTGDSGTAPPTLDETTMTPVSTATENPTMAGTVTSTVVSTTPPSVDANVIGREEQSSPPSSLVSTEAPTDGLSFFGAEAAADPIPSSGSSPESSIVVLAAPFSVTYDSDGRIAGLEDLTATSDVTLYYLNRFFIQHFKFRSRATMRRFVGEVIGRATKPARIGFEIRVILEPGPELPSSEDLDSLLVEAFEQPVVQELLDALGRVQPDNPLSTTDSVTYSPMSPFFLLGGAHQDIPDERGIEPSTEKKRPGLLVAFVVLLVFTSCFVGVRVWCRKGRKSLPKWILRTKTDPQEQNNLMAFRDDEIASSTFGSQCYGELSKFTEV